VLPIIASLQRFVVSSTGGIVTMLRASCYALVAPLALAAGSVASEGLTHDSWSAPPSVTDLGADVLPQAVSDNGKVVVGFSVRANDSGVFRWSRNSGVKTIGGEVAGRVDVSADGRTIGGTVITDRKEAAYWTEQQGWIPLSAMENLVPALPGWDTITYAISADGRRLAGGTFPPPVNYNWERAFSFNPDTWTDRWADFGWQELPILGKGGLAAAMSTSNDGRTQVGSAAELGLWFVAARWRDGHIEALRDRNGERLGGESVVCNSDCNVIVGGGGGSSAVNPILAWRLKSGRHESACHFEPLKGPKLLALRHYAYGVNDPGTIVTGAYYFDVVDESGFARNTAKGFLWLEHGHGGTLVDLQQYLASRKQTFFARWLDIVPVAVSADGRYLVGWGADEQERLRGWRIDFGSAPRPSWSLPPSSSYTRCPKGGRSDHDTLLTSDEDTSTSQSQPWPTIEGTYRSADNHNYRVSARGNGGSHLVSLGGDHYYDLNLRARLTFVRDSAGVVKAIHERGGAGRMWYRIPP
jgi:hypothetical protein